MKAVMDLFMVHLVLIMLLFSFIKKHYFKRYLMQQKKDDVDKEKHIKNVLYSFILTFN